MCNSDDVMIGLDELAADSAGYLVLDNWLEYRQENIEIRKMSIRRMIPLDVIIEVSD